MKVKNKLRRMWLRLYMKMVREKASPEYIARGWAIGMFYGCLIPFGFQLICSIPTAIILNGSKIGATVGTFFTNHFSIFIIYPIQCWVGNRIMAGNLTWAKTSGAMNLLIKEQSYSALLGLGWELVASFFIGGALLTAVMTPLTYFGVKKLVLLFRERKNKKIKEHKTAAER